MQAYNGNGYRVPRGYAAARPPLRYRAVAGVRAQCRFQVLSAVLGGWAGQDIQMDVPQPDGTFETVVFGFAIDGNPAPGADITIQLQGLTTVDQIAVTIAAMLTQTGVNFPTAFRQKGPVVGGAVTLLYPLPGTLGNFPRLAGGSLVGRFQPSSGLNALLRINGVTDYADFDPAFYGGADFSTPLRFGRNFGAALGPDTPQSFFTGE